MLDALISTKADCSDVYERSVLCTKIETSNVLNSKHNDLTTDVTDDTVAYQVLNGNIVEVLEAGTHKHCVTTDEVSH